jgi:hypothetical protein
VDACFANMQKEIRKPENEKKYLMLRSGKGEKIQRPSTASFFRSPRLLYQNMQAV